MGLLASAISKKSGTIDLIRDALRSNMSFAGRNVSINTAIQVATVFACARVIGEGLAQVPLKIMLATGRQRLPAVDHPLYDILAVKPNDWQTSFEYLEMVAWHAVLAGSHTSFINRSVRGGILELIPFEPQQVTMKRDDKWKITYEVRGNDGSTQVFPAEAIWHVKGPSWNGWQALEPVKIAREAIGLAMATEEATARLHKNGVRGSGVYSVEGTLKDDQYKGLKKWIDENYAGVQNTGAPMILDRSAKWLSTQMTGVDAQTIENRRFQIEEICRFARVNPIMVFAESKNTTYASAEQQFLSHVVHTLAPWYSRLEKSINANLLTEAERKAGYYSNFVEEGLLRGAAKDTKDVILGYVNGGVMTTNEGREKLDLNPDTDPASDKLRIPANIVGAVPTGEAV
jgi:HK97 family phage portal protein